MKPRAARLLPRIGLLLYAAVSALITWRLPLNRYEWMLDDPALRDEHLSFCTLPLDADNPAALWALTWIAPLLLLLLGLALSLRHRRMHGTLWIGLALLALWALRFFVLAPHCPAP